MKPRTWQVGGNCNDLDVLNLDSRMIIYHCVRKTILGERLKIIKRVCKRIKRRPKTIQCIKYYYVAWYNIISHSVKDLLQRTIANRYFTPGYPAISWTYTFWRVATCGLKYILHRYINLDVSDVFLLFFCIRLEVCFFTSSRDDNNIILFSHVLHPPISKRRV